MFMREHQEKVMHIKDTYSIFRKGNVLATVKKTLVAPMRQCLVVHVAGVENVEVEGDIADDEYEIHEGRSERAVVSRKPSPAAGTYGVEIVPGADDILILAIAVVVDMMINE